MNKTIKYLALILLTFTLITMPLTVPLFKSSTPYSMFNTNWNGISNFATLAHGKGKEIIPIFGSFEIANISQKTGVLLIIGPNTTFTEPEIDQIKIFLERGNTIFIADDFGTANEILNALGLPVEISRYPLRDFFYQKDDRIIVSIRINNPILAKNVTKIITNEPSGIIVSHKGDIYVSKVAMINLRRKQYPLMTETKYGKGRIIVLADPDILINQLYKENRPFLENLIEYLGSGTFYIDEAHHPDFNLYTAGTVTITRIISREQATHLIILFGALMLLWELDIIKMVARLLWKPFTRFTRRKESLKELALELAKEKGWNENEVMEMLEKMGD